MWRSIAAVLRGAVGFWIVACYSAEEQKLECNLSALPLPDYHDISDKSGSFMSRTVSDFIKVVQPKDFPEDLIKKFATNWTKLKIQDVKDDIMEYERGFVVCTVIGILYIFLMPTVGSMMACCRCAGWCGGDMYQKQSSAIFIRRRNLYWSTVIVTIFLFAGNMCMFGSYREFQGRLNLTESRINDTFDNLKDYINNLPKQISHVADQSKELVDRLPKKIKESDAELQSQLFGDNSAFDAHGELLKVLDTVLSLKEELDTETKNVETKFNKVQENLPTSQKVTGMSFSSGQGATLTTTLNDAKKKLNDNNPTTKIDEFKGTLKNLNFDQLDSVKEQITTQMNMKKFFDIDMLLNPVDKVQMKLSKYMPWMDHVDSIWWRVCISLSFAVLVVVLCNVLGLILGRIGLEEPQEPTKRSSIANCGGISFMVGASWSFLFSWLLMLPVTLLLLVGGNVHALVCRPWSSGEMLEIIPRLVPQLDLAKVLKVNVKLNPSDIYKDCGKNMSLWHTLHLEDGPGAQINKYLDISEHNSKIDDVIKGINIPTISLDFDFDSASLNQKPQKIDTSQLDTKITELNTLANTPHNPQAETLRKAAEDLTEIKNDIENKISPKIDRISDNIEVIKKKIETMKGMADILKDTTKIKDVLKKFLVDEMTHILGCIGSQVKEEFGRCGPLSEVLDSAHTVLCLYLVSSLNAFWFSLGWCLIFFIPSIILSMKLAKYYRRMKHTEPKRNRPRPEVLELGSRKQSRNGKKQKGSQRSWNLSQQSSGRRTTVHTHTPSDNLECLPSMFWGCGTNQEKEKRSESSCEVDVVTY
ncbi:prominin-2 isoform X1 [Syngnathus scovelli]|uniref:prominin-2 isoform X1 n=1 Tax=Syngnathus scovelli TaxID=161590 RepID=UPI002110A2B7|nr:prominin-2 isoform X1 [Syngnathus scovelli]